MSGNVTGASESVNESRLSGALLLALGFWVLLRLGLVAGVDLGKDESAYWYWSGQLDASYAFVPFAAIALVDAVVPGVDWALRLPFLLAGALSAGLLFRLCQLHGLSPNRCLVATAAFATSHWIWHTSSFLHPDGFLVPTWLAVLVCTEYAVRTKRQTWWSLAGAAAGLAALSKYSGLVLAGGWFLWLLLEVRQRGPAPLVRAAVPFGLLASPVLFDLLVSGFALPSALSTLSAVAPSPVPVRLLLFLAAPLFYVSPLLLFLLYRALWRLRRQAISGHLLWPCLILLGTFCAFALVRGQVKGNWILPGLLGLWPLAFSPHVLRSRALAGSLVALGAVLALIPATMLRWPAVTASMGTGWGHLNDTYQSIVSAPDRPREPTVSWTERVCEYHGWNDVGQQLDRFVADRGLPTPVTVSSIEYGLAFGAARYADLVGSVVLPLDPRFQRLAPPPGDVTLWLAREGQSGGLGPEIGWLTRQAEGCQPLRYGIYEPPASLGRADVGSFGVRDSADASRR